MRPSLAERLRGIVSPVPRVESTDAADARPVSREPDGPAAGSGVKHTRARASRSGLPVRAAADALGGEWCERTEGAFIQIEKLYPAGARHGRHAIGSLVERLTSGAAALDILGRAWPSAGGFVAADEPTNTPALVFLDLETTGLAGGAGTQAFLVGCASVCGDGFRVRQLLLPGFEHERALLAELASWRALSGGLVTFNGRTFDVPLIETRFLFHRLAFPLAGVPHLDMLHPARRLWKARPSPRTWSTGEDETCRLSVLERHLAGVHRVGDVPGFDIPSRYFQFVRGGDARPLEAVLEHNRLDLLSLAVVTARAFALIEHGPALATHAQECLGLGRVYERAGRLDDAEACFREAIDWCGRVGGEAATCADAWHRLALCRRRAGKPGAAADAWRSLANLPGCPSVLRHQAREALAIHYEHRTRDLEAAKRLVMDLLAEADAERQRADVEHRLQRLERKLDRSRGMLIAALDD